MTGSEGGGMSLPSNRDQGEQMAVAFEGAQSAALSNRRAVTAIIASTLSWSLDMFDLFILLYVVPAHSRDFR
jgi:hypothetical protein